MDTDSTNFIIKLAGACNLNCAYCYVYNHDDKRYKLRPRVMSREVAEKAVAEIFQYVKSAELKSIILVFHGGEPLLVGKSFFHWLIGHIEHSAPEGLDIVYGLQTNGILIDREWLDIFSHHSVSVGVSVDGPPEIHDRYRVDHAGHGSYSGAYRAIQLLRDDGRVGWGVLCVVNPEFQGLDIYRHFRKIGVQVMDFLLPDHTYENPPPRLMGETPYADFLIKIFDEWYSEGNSSVEVRTLQNIIQMLVGGRSETDALGCGSLSEVVIEADGSLEPLDVLRTCGDGFTFLNLNVLRNSIQDLRAHPLFRIGLESDAHYSPTCRSCPVFRVCGAGYLPHRYSQKKGFVNTSVYCADLEKLILHIAVRIAPDILNAKRRASNDSQRDASASSGTDERARARLGKTRSADLT